MSEFEKIVSEIKKVINGKESAIRIILCAILANENVLIEDIPGTGKTTLVKAFSKVLQLTSKRIQMTSDTLPSDITGYSIYNKEMEKFEFIKGPVFCNILLADELNRTSGRTQSALLEAMEEHQVTVDGKTYKLDEPFSVIATQNPYGYVGTQQLPQAQLDRFSVKISLGYPSVDEEVNILLNRRTENPLDKLDYVISKKEVEDMQMFIDFLTHERELLEKKSSNSGQTKTQKENEILKEKIVETLKELNKFSTITEIQKSNAELANLSNQKISALLKQLVDTNVIEKVIEKKRAYFKA